MAQVVIIGAGLTGISAAYHLEQQGFFDYKLFEKETVIGGLCRSVQQDGFTFDFTGHLLHISDPYFKSLLQHIIGFNALNSINRKSFIYSHQTYTHYPFQINLHGLPLPVIAECIEGFVRRKKKRVTKTFIEWVQSNFGPGFARHFFMPYQKKIFACDLNDLSSSWTGRFVPNTSLEQIIQGVIAAPKPEQGVGYNAQFFYPKEGGIISWVQQLANQLITTIQTGYEVTQIDTQRKIVYFSNGHAETYTHLITTMPLDVLISKMTDRPSTTFNRAQGNLLCNQVVNFNLGISRPDLSDKHWIYFPENEYPFYRLGFPHNFSDTMAPAGCSSLYGEFAHMGKSQAWVNATLKKAIAQTKKILHISESEIATQKIIHINHAYVTYNFWRERNLSKLLSALQEQHIHSVGRYGAWKYASMQEGILDGKAIAEQLLITPARLHATQPRISQTPLQKPLKKELEI